MTNKGETKEVIYERGCGNKCEYWQDFSQQWSNQGMHEVWQNIYILSKYYKKKKVLGLRLPLCSFHHCFPIASFVAEPQSV
jgi:hypothetical protein